MPFITSFTFLAMTTHLFIIFMSAFIFALQPPFASVLKCGVDNHARRSHVLGGFPVSQNGFPWIVSIRLRKKGNHICAGTLISDQFVLTAGHCMYKVTGAKRRSSELFIVVGAHRLNHRGSDESWIFVKTIHLHQRYRRPLVRKWSYDLALVELRHRHAFNRTGRPVCLPSDTAPAIGEQCLVLGWGQTDTADYSNILRAAVTPIISTNTCNRPNYWNGYVDKTMLCAGKMNKLERTGTGACRGDSGGPLICPKGSSNQWAIYGVISWGPILCGEKPGVFANLAKFRTWIRAIVSKNGGTLYDVQNDPLFETSPTTGAPSPNKIDSSKGNISVVVLPPCDAMCQHF